MSQTGPFLRRSRLFGCCQRSCSIPFPESGIEPRLTLIPLACLVFYLFKRKMPYDLIQGMGSRMKGSALLRLGPLAATEPGSP